MKHAPDVVLHKVPDELGDVGRGIYKYKMIEGAFVLKDDLSDWEGMNKRAIINSYRSQRNELLAQTDWTQTEGLRGWEFCPFSPFFANFSTFTKIPQVPSFQAHSPVKTVFPKNAKNARKSQNTPSTNPDQNETQFSPLSLKSGVSRHPRQPKSVICPPVISGTNSRASSLKSAKFRHGQRVNRKLFVKTRDCAVIVDDTLVV